MKVVRKSHRIALFILFLAVAAGCRRDSVSEAPPVIAPTVTSTAVASDAEGAQVDVDEGVRFITVATDAPSRFQDFEDIDEFGNVIGFDPDILANLAAAAGFEYEFVVTSFSGLLDSVASGEFDTAMSALVIPEQPELDLAYTEPYLEVGQVLVVRANESELQSYLDISPEIQIGVPAI